MGHGSTGRDLEIAKFYVDNTEPGKRFPVSKVGSRLF